MIRVIYISIIISFLSACTSTREFYTFDDNDEFGITNSVLFVGGIALLGVGVDAFNKNPAAFSKGFANGLNASNNSKSCNGSIVMKNKRGTICQEVVNGDVEIQAGQTGENLFLIGSAQGRLNTTIGNNKLYY